MIFKPNNSYKIILLILVLMLIPASFIFSQQDIPKIGVVDTSAIYTAYFAESRAIREAVEIQNDIEEESTRIRNEITVLKNQKLDAEQSQNTIEALRLTNLIAEKEQYLNDYIQIKSDRMEILLDNAALQSNLFTEIADAIRYVAFKEGYTMILEKQNPIFLYYSVEIDITDEVLEYLQSQIPEEE
jgi:outer membrane protein